ASHLRVALREARRPVAGEPDEVVEDEHLTVAVAAGADADRRDVELGRDLRGQVEGYTFEHDRERPRRLDGARVVEHALALAGRPPRPSSLDAMPTHPVHRLRRE